MTEALRLWFLMLFVLGLVGAIAGLVRFRDQLGAVEKKVGPLPTPGPVVVSIAALLILTTGAGDTSLGWSMLRVLGVGLSLYAIAMLPWAVRTLGRFGVPGAAVLRDHELVTSGRTDWCATLATRPPWRFG